MIKNVADLRQEYTAATLDIADTAENPIDQFARWFEEALQAEVKEPNAFTLATINAAGRPRARVVLLKGFDHGGFVFYTNYSSAKAAELLAHPYAAMNFFWYDLERQVRIEGKIEKVSTETSREYFQSRPKTSQIGAWASPQSKVITDRAVLDAEMERLSQQYASEEVLPLPPHWGGYLYFSPSVLVGTVLARKPQFSVGESIPFGDFANPVLWCQCKNSGQFQVFAAGKPD